MHRNNNNFTSTTSIRNMHINIPSYLIINTTSVIFNSKPTSFLMTTHRQRLNTNDTSTTHPTQTTTTMQHWTCLWYQNTWQSPHRFEQQGVPGHESSRFERQGVPEHKLSPLWMTMHSRTEVLTAFEWRAFQDRSPHRF